MSSVTSDPIEPAPSEPSVLLDALTHPFRRMWWWLGASIGIWTMLDYIIALVREHSIQGYQAKAALAGAMVTIRCYMATMETTLTNYGDKLWQSSGYDAESEGQSFVEVLCVFAMAFLSAGLWLWSASLKQVPFEPLGTLLAALGCDYFCMGVVGVAFYGGLQGASPFIVLPALWKIGPSFVLAGCAFILVPWMLRLLIKQTACTGSWNTVVAACVTACFLVSHARLITTLYLDNKHRIGWE